MAEDHKDDVEFLSEPTELTDEELEDVPGGGCSDGSGCCSGLDTKLKEV